MRWAWGRRGDVAAPEEAAQKGIGSLHPSKGGPVVAAYSGEAGQGLNQKPEFQESETGLDGSGLALVMSLTVCAPVLGFSSFSHCP